MTIRNLAFFVVVLIYTSSAFAKALHCWTSTKVAGWNGSSTFSTLKVQGKIEGKDLVSPVVEGAFEAHTLGKVVGTTSQNSKWKRFSGMEDAWCSYSVIIPGGFEVMARESFKGVVDKVCDEGQRSGSYRLECTVR